MCINGFFCVEVDELVPDSYRLKYRLWCDGSAVISLRALLTIFEFFCTLAFYHGIAVVLLCLPLSSFEA